MKSHKLFLVLLLTVLGLSGGLQAQRASSIVPNSAISKQTAASFYTFSLDTATYTPLLNAITLNNGLAWEWPTAFWLPAPFPIVLNGSLVDTIVMDPPNALLSGSNPSVPAITQFVTPFGYVALVDRGIGIDSNLSPLNYLVEGNVGSRIAKFEWNEVGSRNEQLSNNGILDNYISFQIWLYEGSHILEYRYGAHFFSSDSLFYGMANGGPIVGMFTDSAWSGDYIAEYWLQGPLASPSLVSTAQRLLGTPANGTVYRFTPTSNPGSNVIPLALQDLVKVYPNPTDAVLYIDCADCESLQGVKLYNFFGQEVRSMLLSDRGNSLDISDLSPGMYILRSESVAGGLRVLKR